VRRSVRPALFGLLGVLGVAAGLALVVAAGATGSGSSQLRPEAPDSKCKAGTTPATIAGKHTCLKAGQKCDRSKDTQYHPYGFHCHTGRLTAGKPAPPSPPPPPPPSLPGQHVDVGGYRLYIECTGSGSPTVIFEAGQGGAAATSPLPGARDIRAAVATDTRVCAYDRAGLGESDPRPAGLAPTGARYADELHALLTGANVPGPYVLVGPSYGGLVVTAFAARYPGEAAGLVFVDSTEPCEQTCTFDVPEAGQFDVGSATFGGRPVVVLVAEFGPEGDGRNLARRSTNSVLVTALGSGHAIIGERPQVVLAATRLVAAAVRAGTRLPPCEQTALPAAGGRCEAIEP